jgi:hypothetical protein
LLYSWLLYVYAFEIFFVVVDRQQQINYLLGYTIKPVHKIQQHIDYMYCWMSRLTMSGVYEFYMEHQMLSVLNSLPEEWMSMRLLLEYKLGSLDFNNLADEMLLERECRYIKKDIWPIKRSANYMDAAAKFITWFEQNEFRGDDFDEVDDVIWDPNYVPAI